MPYRVERKTGARPYKIVNRGTGKVVGSSTSKEKADSSVKARLAGEHGWKSKKGR